MIRSIQISNLRGIQSGGVDDLKPLNVIVGPNNAGKSTLLDGILIGAHPQPPQGLKTVLGRRVGLQDPNRWLIWRAGDQEAEDAAITIHSDFKLPRRVRLLRAGHSTPERSKRSAEGDIRCASEYVGAEPPQQPSGRGGGGFGGGPSHDGHPLKDIPDVRLVDLSKPTGKNELAGLYTEVAERGLREPARLLISDLVPTIKNIEILSPQGKPVVYFMFDEGARPEATAGDGVRYLLRLSLELASPAGGVVLLEEPEMRMHPAAIHQSAKAMWAAAQRGIQVILTTHSLDLIDSLLALGGKAEQLDQLACYRVQLTDGQLHVHRLSGQDASRRRAEIEEDLR